VICALARRLATILCRSISALRRKTPRVGRGATSHASGQAARWILARFEALQGRVLARTCRSAVAWSARRLAGVELLLAARAPPDGQAGGICGVRLGRIVVRAGVGLSQHPAQLRPEFRGHAPATSGSAGIAVVTGPPVVAVGARTASGLRAMSARGGRDPVDHGRRRQARCWPRTIAARLCPRLTPVDETLRVTSHDDSLPPATPSHFLPADVAQVGGVYAVRAGRRCRHIRRT